MPGLNTLSKSGTTGERAGGANNIRSSVLVELDLEEEYQRVNGVGLQSQREAISAVVDERAVGANNIRSM